MVGLGIMGSAMAANLQKAGIRVIGFDVLAARRADHRRSGGQVAVSCRELGRRCRVVICSLPSPAALIETADALASSLREGSIVIETSTLPIGVKEEARARLAGGGAVMLDCPLSGTGAQARVRDLVVFVSGDRDAARQCATVFDGFSRAHYYVGRFGAGTKMKFVANLLVAIHNVAAAEAFVFAMKMGLDPAMVLKVIGDGAGSSRMFQVRGPMMVRGDYSAATMKLDVWKKDMTVIADAARDAGAPTPLFAATAPFYVAATAMCGPDQDTGAVCAVFEQMAGHTRRRRRKKA